MLNVYLENLVQKFGKGALLGYGNGQNVARNLLPSDEVTSKMPKNFKSHLEAIILKGCDLK